MDNKKVAKIVLRVIAVPLLVLLLPPLTLVIVNCFDETLTPTTREWLVPRAQRTVTDANNGYLLLMALDAQVADPLQAAVAERRAYRTLEKAVRKQLIPNSGEPFTAMQTLLLHPSGKRLEPLLSCPKGKNTCYDWYQKNRALLQAISITRSAALQHYEQMLATTDYAEDTPLSSHAPVFNSAYVVDLNVLYLSAVVYAADDGQAKDAYQRWARYQTFWQHAAAGSRTLLSWITAMVSQFRGLVILEHLRHDYPQALALQRQYSLPVLNNQQPFPTQFTAIMIAQFQRQANDMDQMYQLSHATITDTLQFHFFQLNATLNLMQRLRSEWLAQHAVLATPAPAPGTSTAETVCDKPMQWRSVYNPVGKLLGCIGSGGFDIYYRRAGEITTLTRGLQQKLSAPAADAHTAKSL